MWNGFKIQRFTFADREAVIIFPECHPNGRLLLKTEYLDAFPNFDIEMLKRGYHLIHISHRTRWATDEETAIMAEFVRYCAKELHASERCVLEGLSCGGMQAACLAESYPELTAVIYLDAPVLNLLSMAGLGECHAEDMESLWREIVASYGVNKSSIVNFRKSPIDNMKPLIENNIPIIMIYGNADKVVVYEENGKVLEKYYEENGGILKVISKSMCGHNPHGLDDAAPIIKFIEENFRENEI